jgi:two-component SAPR family response regulator
LPEDDLVFGNSMIIDPENNNYYALAFSRLKVDNSLQLVRGNLDEPTIELVANEIPYTNYDNKSFVDLFYFPKSNQLVTFTGLSDESGNTTIKLHKLSFPPNTLPVQVESISITIERNTIIIVILFSILAIVSFIYFKRRKKKQSLIEQDVSSSNGEIEEWKLILDEQGLSETKNKGVHCFGGFRVFDVEENDITGEFTPLLKELYLLILLHTLKDDKGISSEKLLEILWFEKGLEKARNNRAVNIARLRVILDKVGNCEITHNTGYWKIISMDAEIYNDYYECIKITQTIKNPTKREILKLIIIAGKGPFLGNASYEWLDAFKSTTSDSIINTLLRFSEKLNLKNDAHLIIQIADCIFNFDSISEDAMILKCKAHHALGSHSLSKSTYSNFIREYKSLYGEEYAISFADIVSKSRSEIINS